MVCPATNTFALRLADSGYYKVAEHLIWDAVKADTVVYWI